MFVDPTSIALSWFCICSVRLTSWGVGSQYNYIQVLCPSVACVHGKPAPTPSTVSTLPYKTHPETFHYPSSGEPDGREPHHYTSGSIEGLWSKEGLDEETVVYAFGIWGFSGVLLLVREGQKSYVSE